MKVKCPRGPTFFKGKKKKRLNYIFQRHRHAEEYQQCLGPEAEMPKMRIWKINTVELGIVAFFFFLGLLKVREVNTPAGKMDKAGMLERAFPSLLHFAAGMVFPHKAAPAQSLQWPLQDKPSRQRFEGPSRCRVPSFLPSPLLLFSLCPSAFIPLDNCNGASPVSCPGPWAGDSGQR